MITIIPIQSYLAVYYNLLLFFVLVVFFTSFSTPINDNSNLSRKNIFGILIFVFVIFYMGLRPLSIRFGDMVVYAKSFNDYASGGNKVLVSENLFNQFLKFCSSWFDLSTFFLLCTFFYVYPLFSVSRKIAKEFWFYAFFMFIISFTFWAYGTNGIRNGIATSFFLFGIFRTSIFFSFVWIFFAVAIHNSLIIPATAYAIALLNIDVKKYIYFWLLCIPISLVAGSFFEKVFLDFFGDEDKRVMTYLGNFDQKSEGTILKLGFRWDFLLYSALGVFSGWYFIFKKKFNEKLYNHLYITYLITNGFWILVIRANFNNRFAYLSWFMLAVIIIYPLLRIKYFEKQHQLIGTIMFIYFILTYYLDYITNPIA